MSTRSTSSPWLTGAAAVALLAGCGPKPEPKTAPLAPAPSSAPVVVEERPDLSPVKRPADVVGVARLSRPRVVFETLAGWAGLPVRIEDALPPGARALAPAILWEAPVDAVVALDPTGEGKVPPPLAVVSVGLKSLRAALDAADALQLPSVNLAPGIYRIGESPDVS